MVLICENCKREFSWTNGKSKRFCCKSCNNLWHKENNGKEIIKICQYCKKEYKYIIGQKNYQKNNVKNDKRGLIDSSKFCCYECGIKNRNKKVIDTNNKKFGVDFYLSTEECKNKKINTCLKKYNTKYACQSEEVKNKIKLSIIKHFGVDNAAKSKEIKQKIKNTNLKKYKALYAFLTKDNLKKSHSKSANIKKYLTKKFNNSFNISKPEEEIYQSLLKKYPDTLKQYRSEQYPFNCDFYIPSLDLYMEYQGMWTHGNKPYNSQDQECIDLVNKWTQKSLSSKFYKKAVHVYVDLDPLKRKIAKENNLNWIEFFGINEFYEWYNNE